MVVDTPRQADANGCRRGRQRGISLCQLSERERLPQMSVILFDAAKHEYRKADGVAVPSVTQILAKAGICDFSFVEEERRVAAMERGTSVHWLLQLEDEGALNYRQVPLKL